MPSWSRLILLLVLVVGGGLAIGSLTLPGEWYRSLAKPVFNPPNWLFGPAWTVLYILIAFVGARVTAGSAGETAPKIWWAQLVLNFLWSPTFFGAQQIGAGLVVVALMLLAILAFIAAAWPRDRLSALLFLPYASWVAFATALNASIWALN